MKGIIIHWTAGTYHPNTTEFKHYHYLITGDGVEVPGDHTPEDNLDCTDGDYAAHTQAGNTGRIGVAFCGMRGFKSKDDVGEYPLNRKQCEAGFKLIATLCKKYNIAVRKDTVMTHYEFDKRRGMKGRKIDIICLPYVEMDSDAVGDYIRGKIKWYLNRM